MNYTNAIVPLTSPTTAATGPRQRRKLVIVGSGGTGKTCLLMVHSRGHFPTEYVPTVFENYVSEVRQDKKIIDLALWDTAGQEDYDRIRPLSYPDTDVILLCYAINDRHSFEDIRNKWAPEVDHFCEGIPKILVGLKRDTREESLMRGSEEGGRFISAEEGQELAYKVGAVKFMECSAKTRENVGIVFEFAVRAIWEKEKRDAKMRRKRLIKQVTSKCSIM